MPTWNNDIRPIVPGEPVSAGVTNRPTSTLGQQTAYLKELLDSAALGTLIIDNQAAVDAGVLPGMPVYWNAIANQYAPALAGVMNDPISGALTDTLASDVVGVCWQKTGPVTADIALAGVVPIDMSGSIIGTILPGRYYLSPASAGGLVQMQPPVSVPVCTVLNQVSGTIWRVIVMPQVVDFATAHTHYRFNLVCSPAGTTVPPTPGNRHFITSPDPTKPGWLPAHHAVFNGLAPETAVFGYNIAHDTQLNSIWPPIPVQAINAFWDKGVGHLGATEIPQGNTGLIKFDSNGIWWMSDCYGDVPWPVNDTGPPILISSEGSLGAGIWYPECAREEEMRLSISFVKMLFMTDKSVVTSLFPAKKSPILVLDCNGVPTQTGRGDLQLGLNLALIVNPTEAYGGQALKAINPDNTFAEGWLTEGLIAGSTNVHLTGTRTRFLIPTDPTSPVVNQGLVTIAVDLDLTAKAIQPQLIRLNDVKERFYDDMPYIGFIATTAGDIRCMFNIPAAGLNASPTLTIRTLLFGRGNGTLPPFTLVYRTLPRPTSVPIALPTIDSAPVSFPSGQTLTTDHVIEVSSAPIAVNPGDTVSIDFLRSGPDGFASEIGLLRIEGILN